MGYGLLWGLLKIRSGHVAWLDLTVRHLREHFDVTLWASPLREQLNRRRFCRGPRDLPHTLRRLQMLFSAAMRSKRLNY